MGLKFNKFKRFSIVFPYSPRPPQGFQAQSSISNLLLQTSIESSIDSYYEWTVLGIENSLWNVSSRINLIDNISNCASWKRTLHVWLNFMRIAKCLPWYIASKRRQVRVKWTEWDKFLSLPEMGWKQEKIGGWMKDLPYGCQALAQLL